MIETELQKPTNKYAAKLSNKVDLEIFLKKCIDDESVSHILKHRIEE